MRSVAITLIAAVALSVYIPQPDPIPGFELFESGPWPPNASFQALFVGRLASVWDADVAVLRGGELRLLLDVASRRHPLQLATGVTDAVLLPGSGSNGLDGVLATDSSGARLYTWSAGPSIESVLSSEWADATLLRSGVEGIYALSRSGNEILRVSAIGGSPPVDLAVLDSSGTVRDIRPLDWDGDGNEDLAVLYTDELVVRSLADWGGEPLYSYPAFGATDRIAVSRSFLERDFLAWAFDMAGVTYVAALHSDHTTEPVLNLGAVAAGIACFDYGFDGAMREDLIISDPNSSDVYVLERQAPGSAHTFWLYDGPIRFALGDEGSGTLAAGGDIDGDGDIDALFGLQAADELRVHLNDRIERHSLAPRLVDAVVDEGTISLEFEPHKPGTSLEIECRFQTDPEGPSRLFAQLSGVLPGWVSIPIEDLDFYDLQFIVRDVSVFGGTKYPTKTYLYAPDPEAYLNLLGVPEIAQYSSGDPGGTPKLPPGFTPSGRSIGLNP